MNKTASQRMLVKVAQYLNKRAALTSPGAVGTQSGQNTKAVLQNMAYNNPGRLSREATATLAGGLYDYNNNPGLVPVGGLYNYRKDDLGLAAGAALGNQLNKNKNNMRSSLSSALSNMPMPSAMQGYRNRKWDTIPGISQYPVMNKMWQDAYNRHN